MSHEEALVFRNRCFLFFLDLSGFLLSLEYLWKTNIIKNTVKWYLPDMQIITIRKYGLMGKRIFTTELRILKADVLPASITYYNL